MWVGETSITDEGLQYLGALKKLKMLAVHRTAVTDAGLEHLRKLDALWLLMVEGTGVTREGAERLAEALPRLSIGFGKDDDLVKGQAVEE